MEWFESAESTLDILQQTALAVGSDAEDALLGRLEKLGFDVISARTITEARELLAARAEDFALVGLAADVSDEEHLRFLEHLRDDHPELPVVAPAKSGGLCALTDQSLNPTLLTSARPANLWDDLYPEWLVRRFELNVADTLELGFGWESFPRHLRIKANRGRHDGVIAAVHLTGEVVGGRVGLYGAHAVLDRLAADLKLGTTNPAERAVDLAGEITNQIAGRLKGDFARRGLLVQLGVPILVEGTDMTLRFREGQPSLMQQVSTDLGDFSVELCLGSRLPADPSVSTDVALECGECELF